MIKLFKNLISWLIWKFNNRLFFDQWQLLFSFENNLNFKYFVKIIPPKDRFWADPFVVKVKNKFYVFYEELIYSENKGRISCLEIDANGIVSNFQTVLEKKYHLSYPFIIEHEKSFYMIPETGENNTIELYKSLSFPNNWSLKKILIPNIIAYDSTILEHNSKYWLFTNVKNPKNNSTWDTLHLFYSDSLLDDEWKPHPLNPIVSNISFARPAGNIYKKDNKIYRPAQNCSLHYGYAIEIREITVLDEYNYAEESLKSIYPSWDKNIKSIHTINSLDGITIVDAKIKRKKYLNG
jgi:hypothetical protein